MVGGCSTIGFPISNLGQLGWHINVLPSELKGVVIIFSGLYLFKYLITSNVILQYINLAIITCKKLPASMENPPH